MKKIVPLSHTPESIERKRALEFLALSPTEKYDALINLIKITNDVREAGKRRMEAKTSDKNPL